LTSVWSAAGRLVEQQQLGRAASARASSSRLSCERQAVRALERDVGEPDLARSR